MMLVCPECGAPCEPTQHADLSPGVMYVAPKALAAPVPPPDAVQKITSAAPPDSWETNDSFGDYEGYGKRGDLDFVDSVDDSNMGDVHDHGVSVGLWKGGIPHGGFPPVSNIDPAKSEAPTCKHGVIDVRNAENNSPRHPTCPCCGVYVSGDEEEPSRYCGDCAEPPTVTAAPRRCAWCNEIIGVVISRSELAERLTDEVLDNFLDPRRRTAILDAAFPGGSEQ